MYICLTITFVHSFNSGNVQENVYADYPGNTISFYGCFHLFNFSTSYRYEAYIYTNIATPNCIYM